MGGIYLRYDDAGRAWTAVGSRAKWADAVAYSEYGAWTAGVDGVTIDPFSTLNFMVSRVNKIQEYIYYNIKELPIS